jgi:hypothetical protein
VERYDRAEEFTDENIIRRMSFPRCITKVIDTHSECVILIDIRRPRWLRERASVLRYRYIPFLITVYHSKDNLFWLLGEVYTSDRPRCVLLVCSLINTNVAFADVTCELTQSPGNLVWQYILKYTLLLL